MGVTFQRDLVLPCTIDKMILNIREKNLGEVLVILQTFKNMFFPSLIMWLYLQIYVPEEANDEENQHDPPFNLLRLKGIN